MGARHAASHDDDDFDPRVSALIRRKARRLARGGGNAGFRHGDELDLRQELALHLVLRMQQYDPARASVRTFADRVLTAKAADLARHAAAAKRDRRRERPMHGGDLDEQDVVARRGRAWDPGRVDMRLDVGDALADLPDDARAVAGLLMVLTVAEVARRTGLTRQRVRTMCRRIEGHLLGRGLP